MSKTTLELIGLSDDQLVINCTKAPPEGVVDDYYDAARADATALFQALDGMLPYGTWTAFLGMCGSATR
jgi:hypothetical protein